jgi:hypothetical protein|tara:strand:- start:349 stop:489 length:141 start_codon:yes stop_codon:yes gene_type:complete
MAKTFYISRESKIEKPKKKTSIGNSKNSFGSTRNKRNDRKKYRGQG